MFFIPTSITKYWSRRLRYSTPDGIRFELSAEFDDILEISTDCVVCHPGLFRLYYKGKRELLTPWLYVNRGDSADRLLHHNRIDCRSSREAVGAITFSRWKHEPPSFYFTVSLNPQTFDSLVQDVISGAIPTKIAIHWDRYYGDREMGLGWEPDGSRTIWDIPENQSAQWPIEEIGFTTEVWGSKIDAEDIPESETHEKQASNSGAAAPPRSPSISLDELVTEVRETNSKIQRLIKIMMVLVSLVALIGLILFGTR